MVITEIHDALTEAFSDSGTIAALQKLSAGGDNLSAVYDLFLRWLLPYIDEGVAPQASFDPARHANEKIYGALDTSPLYRRAVIDYISSMTDRFAVETFGRLISYA
jgi:dGTP triphosphohydrolase